MFDLCCCNNLFQLISFQAFELNILTRFSTCYQKPTLVIITYYEEQEEVAEFLLLFSSLLLLKTLSIGIVYLYVGTYLLPGPNDDILA